MLMEGSPNLTVNVKNRDNCKMGVQTPVITSGNRLPWEMWCAGEGGAFMNRSFVFKFGYPIAPGALKNIMYEEEESVYREKIIMNPLIYVAYYCKLKYDWSDDDLEVYMEKVSGMIETEETLEWVGSMGPETYVNLGVSVNMLDALEIVKR